MPKPYNSVSKLDRLIEHYEERIRTTNTLICEMQQNNNGSTTWVEEIRALLNDIGEAEGRLAELLQERERMSEYTSQQKKRWLHGDALERLEARE